MTVEDGEFVALLGPSGCGKTSTLRMIVGLETITGGTIRVRRHGRQRADAGAAQRRHGIRDLCALSELHRGGESRLSAGGARHRKAERAADVARIAKLLRIEHILDQKPAPALRRPAAARLARTRADPRAGRLHPGRGDEPPGRPSEVPDAVRAEAHPPVRRQDHGLRHARPGRGAGAGRPRRRHVRRACCSSIGTRDDLYHRPANRFVADFIGEPPTNFFTAAIVEQRRAAPAARGARDGRWLPARRSARAPRCGSAAMRPRRRSASGRRTCRLNPRRRRCLDAGHGAPERVSGRAVDPDLRRRRDELRALATPDVRRRRPACRRSFTTARTTL